MSANGQARVLNELLERDVFSSEELDVIRRGKNYKRSSHPKHTDLATYKQSSGFEALIGYLYLSHKQERLDEILRMIEVK